MILGILQARVSSSRLPGKVLKPILGAAMLERQLERVQRSRCIERLIVATSEDASDAPLEELCKRASVECFRGSLEDVLDRFYRAALKHKPEYVVRLTGDCPLLDPAVIDSVIRFCKNGSYDYATNAIQATYPDGLDVEVFTMKALEEAWKEAKLPSDREHVTPFMNRQPERYKIGHFKGPQDLSHLRWTVDEPEDFELISRIYEALYPANASFTTQDVLNFLEKNPKVAALNQRYTRNEGYLMSLKKDELAKRYAKSTELLARAQKTIPLGSQTFSKSRTQYPAGVSPFFIQRGKGSQVWDVDGNSYTDFVSSLCALNLGHADPDVNRAVLEQFQDGVIFTLPHPLEMEVAEKIVEMVPCAEMVRFGKNGSDATTGAIRLARAFTRRDHVAVCGYHGWQDWYIGSTTRNLGVPEATRALTHVFKYNDIDSLDLVLKEHKDQFAAVIMEPMNVEAPKAGFLEEVKKLAHQHGALFIFDETITGFRYANGGAQELFGVTPDLATFGKGMANGYPISAVAGAGKYMKLMEEIFFSFTFGGEALSLAAALATMKKLQAQPVIKRLYAQGEKIMGGVRKLISQLEMDSILSVSGNPTWNFLNIKDAAPYSAYQLKTLFLQEVFQRGVLTLGSHNMTFAHTDEDVNKILSVYAEVLPLLRDAVANRSLEKQLQTKALEPLFKVR